MKRIIGIAMCVVMLAGAAQASAQKKGSDGDKQKTGQVSDKQGPGQGDDRQPPSPEDMAKRQSDRMKEQLSLTDGQYAKVFDLNKAQAEKRGNMAPTSREDMEKMTDEQKAARREEMRKSRDEYNAKLKEILTDEQYTKYGESMRNGPRGGHPGQRPQSGGSRGERTSGGNN